MTAAAAPMTDSPPTNAALRKVSLPTGRLLRVMATVGVVTTALAGGAAWAMGTPRDLAAALAGSGVAVAASMVGLLSIRPWRARPIVRWPLSWLAGSGLAFLAAIGGSYLLYSATPLGSDWLWIPMAATYFAVLLAKARAYANHMRQFLPAPSAAPSE